jgi:hypothetical protein
MAAIHSTSEMHVKELMLAVSSNQNLLLNVITYAFAFFSSNPTAGLSDTVSGNSGIGR